MYIKATPSGGAECVMRAFIHAIAFWSAQPGVTSRTMHVKPLVPVCSVRMLPSAFIWTIVAPFTIAGGADVMIFAMYSESDIPVPWAVTAIGAIDSAAAITAPNI